MGAMSGTRLDFGRRVKGGIQGRTLTVLQVALAHYPSLDHFADMLASEDYQDVNKKYRVPSLKDTCILCTSELGIEKLRPTARL